MLRQQQPPAQQPQAASAGAGAGACALSPAEESALSAAVAASLPANYAFEVRKTVARARGLGARRVALQLPVGLLRWGCARADIIARFARAEAVILGDVAYGACCVDDLAARALGCDLLVHYGHSCLVPVARGPGALATLYVFVDIAFDTRHLDFGAAKFPVVAAFDLAAELLRHRLLAVANA